jgi:hypothetical protein
MYDELVKNKKTTQFTISCFALLSLGTLPSLFMNPMQYFLGLVFCFFLSVALAKILL